MKILEEAPTHYRVRLDSGHEMVIARTPGTQALVLSSAPEGLADGGEVSGSANPYDSSTLSSEYSVTDAGDAFFLQQNDGGTSQPVRFEKSRLKPNERAALEAGAAKTSERVSTPQPDPAPAPAPGSEPVDQTIAKIPGAGVDPYAAIPDYREPGPQVPAYVGQKAAQPAEPLPHEIERGAVAPAGTASAEPEGEGVPDTLRNALDFGSAQQLPLHDSALDQQLLDAQKAAAEHQAGYAEQNARTIAGSVPPPAPKPAPVDPGQLYAHVGAMFGAKSPQAQRLIGGIATGLMAGIGEIGAALSHRENMAAKIIQDAIHQNIASQNGANALTREQWVDQINYANTLVQKKIAEIGEYAKASQARDQVPILQAQVNIAKYQQMVALGLMKPEYAEKLVPIENARAAIGRVAHIYKQTPSGLGGWLESKWAPISDDPTAAKITAAVNTANEAYVAALGSAGVVNPRADKLYEANKINPWDKPQIKEAKMLAMLSDLRVKHDGLENAARGYDPTGVANRGVDFKPMGTLK